MTRNGPGGNFTFGWTADDRLTSISGAVTVSYRYDYQGRRSSKTVAGQTPVYLYRGLDLVRETGPSPAEYLFGLGIDEPLAISQGGSIFYPIVDALGSINALADSAGAVQNNYVYDAWGITKSQSGSVANPFGYTAREFGEAGALFYRARYMQPSVGRFLSEDPMWHAAQFDGDASELGSAYWYVENSPLLYADPTGLAAFELGRSCKKLPQEQQDRLKEALDEAVGHLPDIKACGRLTSSSTVVKVNCGNCGGHCGRYNPFTGNICINVGAAVGGECGTGTKCLEATMLLGRGPQPATAPPVRVAHNAGRYVKSPRHASRAPRCG